MGVELVRVDFRMIHGQVMVKWLKQTGAKKIVGVNDGVATDPFLGDIYKMSAPVGVDIDIMTRDQAAEHFSGEIGEKVLVLFKCVEDAEYCFKKGFPMRSLQIGGLGAGPGRVNVYGPITLDAKDAAMLKGMSDAGVEVVFQQVPDESSTSLEKILKKFDFGLR